VTAALLERGRERFEIFCTPCHGQSGHGDGLVVQRGFPRPPDLHDPALLAAPDRHFYEVITRGYGAMFAYGSRVPPADRWAIVAYVRALQLAGHAEMASLPDDMRSRLEATP
jgi:mono/diheme cytochrome c family protein